jgi:hypothetical protein
MNIYDDWLTAIHLLRRRLTLINVHTWRSRWPAHAATRSVADETTCFADECMMRPPPT